MYHGSITPAHDLDTANHDEPTPDWRHSGVTRQAMAGHGKRSFPSFLSPG